MIAQRAVRAAAFVLASSYTNMAAGIVYGVVMARLLAPEQFGLFTLAMALFALFDLRGKLGLDHALMSRQQTGGALLATHWMLQMGASLVTLAGVLAASAIASAMGREMASLPIMIALAGAMLVESAGSTARTSLEKELEFRRSTLVVSGALIASYLGAIAMAVNGFGVWALVGQAALNALLATLGFWWAFRRMPARPALRLKFDPGIARWMLRFGAVMAVGAVATSILLQFDYFLIGNLVNLAALGFYERAYRVAQWPTGLVTHIISRAAMPTYAKLQDDPVRLSRAFEMSLWAILTVALPLALGIFAAAPDLILLLYGEAWLPSVPLLRLLIAYSVLRPLLDDTGALFTAIGQPGKITTVLVIQAVTLMILATPLTLEFGAPGTALGVGATFAVGIFVTYRFVAGTLSFKVGRLFGPPVLAAAGSVLAWAAFSRAVDLADMAVFWRVLAHGAVAAGAYALLLVALERRSLFDRLAYIWRLLRPGPA